MTRLDSHSRWVFIAVVALFMLALYIVVATGLVALPRQLTFLWAFAIGPLAIIGVLSIARVLESGTYSLGLQSAKAFGIAAFVIWEMMIIVQSGSRIHFRENLIPGAATDAAKEALRAAYQAANTVQFTMDVSFDIFYCLAVILFSVLMFHHPSFGKAISVYGVITGLGLLVLNLWTFPMPPAESGLVDFGPLTGVWWIVVIILMFRGERSAAATSP